MVRILSISIFGVLGLAALSTGAFASDDFGVNSDQKGDSLPRLTQYADTAQAVSGSVTKASKKKRPPPPPPPLPWCKDDKDDKDKKKKNKKNCKWKPKPVTPK